MNTPMKEAEEYILGILKESGVDMGTYGLIELKFQEMSKKEKEVMCEFSYKCRNVMAADKFAIKHWYDQTFNTKESSNLNKETP